MRARYAILQRLFPGWIWSLPEESRQIALTFDDGPDPETTGALLAELERLDIPATMFLTGEECAGRDALIRDISTRGHAVANHGYLHERHLLRGRKYLSESIQKTEDMIRASGIKPQRLFRPPFGGFDLATRPVLNEYGYAGVMWTAIVDDWVPQSTDKLWRKLRSKLHSGAVIVLHDGHDTTETMIQILPRLAEYVRAAGWSFTTLSTPHSEVQ